jgi:type II secretion system protein J
MSLTVLIAVISYRFLDASIRVQEQGEAAQQSLAALEQAWQLLAYDLQNSIDRPVVLAATGTDVLSGIVLNSEGAVRRPSLMSAQFLGASLAQLLSRDGALLWFTRQGWVNPLGEQRSEIQRVLYRLDNNGNLFRDYWSERNQDLRAMPEGSFLVLKNVRNVQIGYLALGQYPDSNAWLSQWPTTAVGVAQDPASDQSGNMPIPNLPAALRVSLELGSVAGVGLSSNESTVIQRIFLLAGY